MRHILELAAAVPGLLCALAALPLALELLVLSCAALLPVRRVNQAAAAKKLQLAVIIPAHNEQQLIAACVASVSRSRGAGTAKIYVVAHNCTDATAEQAADAGAEVLVLNDTIGGKGTALNFGFAHALAAGADAVLVIDADSHVAENLVPAVLTRLAAGAAALQCQYEVSSRGNDAPRTRLAALAFLGMNVLRPRGRARLGLSCGIFGNGFALSADTLRQVPYGANSLVEDLEYHLLLIRAGLRVDFADEATVYGEMPDNNAAAATQRTRWEGGRMLMRQQWSGPLLTQVLRGKLRLLEPLLDLLSVPLATGAALMLLGLILAVAGRSPLLGAVSAAGLFAFVLYVLVAASLSARPGQMLSALAQAPAFLLWKLMLLPRTRLAARKDAAWVRTARNEGKQEETR